MRYVGKIPSIKPLVVILLLIINLLLGHLPINYINVDINNISLIMKSIENVFFMIIMIVAYIKYYKIKGNVSE